MKSIFQKIGNLSLPLIAGIVAALIWANIDSASYDRLIYGEIFRGVSLHFLINDVFLVFFFAQMGVEIVRGATPGGNLYPLKNTIGKIKGFYGNFGVLIKAYAYILMRGNTLKQASQDAVLNELESIDNIPTSFSITRFSFGVTPLFTSTSFKISPPLAISLY